MRVLSAHVELLQDRRVHVAGDVSPFGDAKCTRAGTSPARSAPGNDQKDLSVVHVTGMDTSASIAADAIQVRAYRFVHAIFAMQHLVGTMAAAASGDGAVETAEL